MKLISSNQNYSYYFISFLWTVIIHQFTINIKYEYILIWVVGLTCFWHLNQIYFYFYLLINTSSLVIDFPIKLMGWEILTFPWPGESSTLSHATLPWHGSFSRQKLRPETMETRGRWARVCKVATIVAVTFHSRIVCIVWKASKGFCMHLSRGHPILFRLVFFVPLYAVEVVIYTSIWFLIVKLILSRYQELI